MSRRVYRPQFEAVVSLLERVFLKDEYADKILPAFFKEKKQLGSKDRKFIAENFYDIVRFKLKYDALLASLKLEQTFENILGLHLLYCNTELPPFKDIETLPNSFPSELADKMGFNVSNSFPEWMGEKLGANYSEEQLTILNSPTDVFIRVNTILIEPLKLYKLLSDEGFVLEGVASSEKTFLVQNPKQLSKSRVYKDGLFEVQDIGSQRIGAFVNPQKEDVILDVCAGAGGKTLQLAADLNNEGQIIASDIEEWKLENLNFRVNKAGVKNVEVSLIENLGQYTQKINKILIDAPCTGIGTIRRKPDLKYKITEASLAEKCKIQAELLQIYSAYLPVNGELIYATCSLFKEENELQIEHFLRNNKSFSLVKQLTVFPELNSGDGFYMAKLKRA
jgi:16S rRNA (cytosine967-C5)-methyltransferase